MELRAVRARMAAAEVMEARKPTVKAGTMRWLASATPLVTKPVVVVTKPKNRGGRPAIGEKAMSGAERIRRMRAKRREPNAG